MKPAQYISLTVLLIAALIATSCKKDRQPAAYTAPIVTVRNPQPGKEFYFDATWTLWTDQSGDEIYISIDPSNTLSIADLATGYGEISINLGSSPDWIVVPVWDWHSGQAPLTVNDYSWYFNRYPYALSTSFIVESSPLNYQLVGQPVKVRVKF